MKTRSLIYLVIAAAVLLVIYYVLDRTSVPVAKEQYLVKVDSSKVSEISIFKGGQTVTLSKKDSTWYITNPVEYRANSDYVAKLLNKLSDMRLESVISKDKAKWPEFEVDTSGTQVTLTQGGKTTEFVIGKASSGYRHTYARMADKEEVDLIRGIYGIELNRNVESWRDKDITTFSGPEIVDIQTGELHLTRPGREAPEWKLERADGTVDSTDKAKAAGVQNAIGRLKTSGFPKAEEYAKVNFKRPTATLKVGLFNGETHTYEFFKDPDQDNRFFVIADGDTGTVFRIYQGIYNQIFKKPEDVLPSKAPAGAMPGKPMKMPPTGS